MKGHPSQWINSGLTCRDIADRASDYLEEQLPVLTNVRVGLHLTSCRRCRAYIQQLALVSSTLRTLPKIYPSPLNRLRLHQHFAAHHLHQTNRSLFLCKSQPCLPTDTHDHSIRYDDVEF
ncbi:zf-HC2 domain-containing protein [Petrachloros mirabilis]